MATKSTRPATLPLKTLVPLAVLALAALSPAPIKDKRPNLKPIPEQSQATVLKEMQHNGTFRPVGRVPARSEPQVVPDPAPIKSDSKSVASAGTDLINRDDGTLTRASEHLQKEEHAFHMPTWLLIAIALGGAFGTVRGLRAWADKALPAPRR